MTKMVSSLSMAFKRATKLTEDREEAKKEHRTNLRTLVEKYMDDVQNGKAEGIRNAKDLVEVIKADLLLLGEATERTENTNELDEIRVQKISQIIDVKDPNIRGMMANMLKTLNDVNDEADIGTNKKSEMEEENDYAGVSIMSDEDALMELANQAMQDYQDSMEDKDE